MITQQGKGGINHSTNQEYRVWIERFISKVESDPSYVGDNWTLAMKLKGRCYSASTDMQEYFPELRLIRGHVVSQRYIDMVGPEYSETLDPGDGHIWLETEAGDIVDPTRQQYPEGLIYVAFDESKAHTLPTGKCPNCGSYCYNNKDCCSDDCFNSYVSYIQSEMRM